MQISQYEAVDILFWGDTSFILQQSTSCNGRYLPANTLSVTFFIQQFL